MAPESILKNVYSIKSDVYAFGIVLYEIVTQEDPWAGFSLVQVIQKVSNGEKMPLSGEIPTHFQDIMNECWNTDPSKRPLFEELIEKLEAIKVEFSKPETSLQSARTDDYQISPVAVKDEDTYVGEYNNNTTGN